MGEAAMRSGGAILVDQLLLHGAECGFCVPGESYLAVLDALHDVRDRFALYNARHEAGAAVMAEAYGKLTGRPGICLVTRGPGACHASVGVHIAFQDSTPMVLLVGQVRRDASDREGFQEVDLVAMFRPLAKWAAQVEDAARLPEYLSRAFRVAVSGRPGPVVLALPEDMLSDNVTVEDARPYAAAQPLATAPQIDALLAELERARRPLAIVGGPGWSDAAAGDLRRFAEAADLPVACSFRRQDVLDNRSPCFVGDFGTGVAPDLVARMGEADLLVVLGARLGEITTGAYARLTVPVPRQRVVHVHTDADEIGRVFAPDLGIAATAPSAATALARRVGDGGVRGGADADWRERLRRAYLADIAPPTYPHPLDLGAAMVWLREYLPADAVITLDAGNHTGWPQRYLLYGRPGRQLGSTCGSMGYAVPAAVAASLREPGRAVLAFVGDGGFMMSGAELATAAQHGARPVVLVFNNATYGTIRMHQERSYPGRVSGTDLVNPDFGALAAGLGAGFWRVGETAAFAPALEAALGHGGPAVVELLCDPAQISTRATIDALRAAALARQGGA